MTPEEQDHYDFVRAHGQAVGDKYRAEEVWRDWMTVRLRNNPLRINIAPEESRLYDAIIHLEELAT